MALALLFEYYLLLALAIVALGLALWSLVDCLMRPAARFAQEGKRTKGFWTGLTVAATFATLLGLFSPGGIFQLVGACIACVYLADVRPAVSGRGGYYNY
ncbi:DUF2516 family protein [Neomicrococcus aestuarii]|uniref:DUF2516 domain-containing protein n=1 Tax=Neomicrococcus aestuarii TaxID=556325 RepID=A0A1L2ZN72_9MICC|nr:DUF2516 family protein [Neomicrococcus aestuarii]APF40667.1 hypothetical protein BHE16_06160 [Neomicrococcus aestuarii]MBB5512375.1 hypothetical protein [Neomicrococcus aestuarii]